MAFVRWRKSDAMCKGRRRNTQTTKTRSLKPYNWNKKKVQKLKYNAKYNMNKSLSPRLRDLYRKELGLWKGTEDGELQRVGHDPCKPVLSHSPSAPSPDSLKASTT